MYKISVTDGIVLKKSFRGEANVAVSILTRELGLLRAVVRSARREKSKLRYGIEPLTQGRFSFVRGQREWRLVGMEGVSRLFPTLSFPHTSAAGRIVKLLLRLIQGQEPTPLLYKTLQEGLISISCVQEKDLQNTECVLVLRILAHLGYVAHVPELAPFMENDFFSEELAAAAVHSRSLLIRTINQSLKASEL